MTTDELTCETCGSGVEAGPLVSRNGGPWIHNHHLPRLGSDRRQVRR